MTNYLILFTAIGLLALWVIALAVGGVASWFLWLVFAASLVLFFTGATEIGSVRRRVNKPV
jgi:hypothetical protein